MSSDAPKAENSVTGHLRISTSSLLPVDEKILEWKFSSPERYFTSADETGGAGKRYNNDANTTSIGHEGTKKAAEYLQAKNITDGNSNSTRKKRKTSGSFLLPNILPGPSSSVHHSSQDSDRRHSRKEIEKMFQNTRSSTAAHFEGGSLDAKKRRTIGKNESVFRYITDSPLVKNSPELTDANSLESKKTALDVESIQIVNIALNLSESRRAAPRRAILSPSISSGVPENESDRSLRQLAQRRVTRTSSKPDGVERAFTSSLQSNDRGIDRLASTTLNSDLKQVYLFSFSPSTLARSEKAKITIELMAQYRRLLHFVPPLSIRPDKSENFKNPASEVSDQSEELVTSSFSNKPRSTNQLGRDYNPLQYIRNRRLRARMSKSIDGETQGFGDLEKVSKWIDNVAKSVLTSQYHDTNKFSLPNFPSETLESFDSNSSERFYSDKKHESPAKIKRPRVDWIIKPADLIADLYWLEQGENKKLIEDRDGNRIFSEEIESSRSVSCDVHKGEKGVQTFHWPHQKGTRFNLRIDTDIPAPKSSKSSFQEVVHKVPQDNHDMYNTVFLHQNPGRRCVNQLRPHTRSSSSSRSFSSDGGRGRIQRRPDAKDRLDSPALFISKKQKEFSFKKDSNLDDTSNEADFKIDSFAPQNSLLESGLEHQPQHQKRLTSVIDTFKPDSQNNQIYNFHDIIHRYSGEYRESASDSTVPSSYRGRTKKFKGPKISIIKPALQKAHNLYPKLSDEVEDKENKHRSFSRTRINTSVRKPSEDLEFLEKEPLKLISDSDKLQNKSLDLKKARPESERFSGIREFLKNARNPASRISDYLWRKDSPGFTTGSGDLDHEDLISHPSKAEDLSVFRTTRENRSSRRSSIGFFFSKKDQPIHQEQETILSAPHDKLTFTNQREFEICSKHKNLQCESVQQKKQDKSQTESNNISPKPSLNQGRPMRSDSISSDSSFNLKHRPSVISEATTRLDAIQDVTEYCRKAQSVGRLTSFNISDQKNQHKWLNSDGKIKIKNDYVTSREIARVRTLLVSSGIKAKEIKRRAEVKKSLTANQGSPYFDVAVLTKRPLVRVSNIQKHQLAIQIISEDINRSLYTWNSTSEMLIRTTIKSLRNRISTLQTQILESLTPITRSAADEADALSRDLVTDHRLAVTHVADQITYMTRRRRARFRWFGRGWWVVLEWVLIGIMWWVWFLVVITRIILGTSKIIIGGVRWLFWL